MTATTMLGITPVTAVVGSIIEGVDITQPLAPDVVGQLHEALRERGVLFFRDHELSDAQMHRFASYFGQPIPEPAIPNPGPDTPVVGRPGQGRGDAP